MLEAHPDMAEHLLDTMSTIEAPEHREDDERAGRERYFRRGGPLRWIRVVTDFAGGVDRVVTAYPQSNDPRQQRSRR